MAPDEPISLKEALKAGLLRRTWPWIAAAFPCIVLLEAQAVAPVGHWSLLFFEIVFLVPLLAAPVALIVLPFIALKRSVRAKAIAWWIAAALFIPVAVGGLLVGKRIRHRGFEKLAERSVALVSAISAYEKQHGQPPPSLEALVPSDLPRVPKTGMMAYPTYRYYVGDEARAYESNSWVLTILTPSGGMNFDQFMYFPLQNYPQAGYGGSLERIRDWAYVHE